MSINVRVLASGEVVKAIKRSLNKTIYKILSTNDITLPIEAELPQCAGDDNVSDKVNEVSVEEKGVKDGNGNNRSPTEVVVVTS